MFGSARCSTGRRHAPHPSCGGQVRLARGTPRRGGGERWGFGVPSKIPKSKIKKNNLSNELALRCAIQLMELSWTR